MKRDLKRLCKAILALDLCLSAAVFAAGEVDDQRLRNADAANWINHGRDYSNQRFSPLTQITPTNVKRLVPRWIYQTGVAATFQATPIVVDGIMYLAMPFNHVAAIDARSGREIWRYEHRRRTQAMCCGPANRGVAVAYGKVYIATVDARLIALDQKTGKVVWDKPLATESGRTESLKQLGSEDLLRQKVAGSTGVGAAMAPAVFDGKVYVGITGVGYGLHLDNAVVGVAGSYGRPGFLASFDAATGDRIWRFDTIADRGWEGQFRETTPDGVSLNRDIVAEKASVEKYADAWRSGGGSTWSTPAIDPAAGLIYFGIGNPSPQMDDITRPGDNLYTVSLVALEAATGKLVWHYQQVPHDLWGYDVASSAILFDLNVDGKKIPVVGQAGKTGWFYVNDRLTGRLLFKSEAFVPQENLFVHPTKEGVRVTPGAAGGASWSPAAYHPGLGLAYVAALHRPLHYQIHDEPAEGDKPASRYTVAEATDEPTWGTLTAIDVRNSGKIRWQRKTPQPLIGGVLATAGGLVFTGEGDGNFSAFDARDGRLLWQFQCGAGVNAPPISFEIDGTQYVAVAAGGNQLFGYRQGSALIVFALPK